MPIESRIVHLAKRATDRGTKCGLDTASVRKNNDYVSNSLALITCLPCLRKMK